MRRAIDAAASSIHTDARSLSTLNKILRGSQTSPRLVPCPHCPVLASNLTQNWYVAEVRQTPQNIRRLSPSQYQTSSAQDKDADVRSISNPTITTIVALALALVPSSARQASPAPQSVDASSKILKVRVARLSEVKGDVAIDRSMGAGFEHAFTNLPITEQSRLQTGAGRAEVEFEDNSTLRLAPYTLVEFPRLALLPSGAKTSTIHILKGTAYVSLIPDYLVNTKGNDFTLTFGQERLHLRPSNHIRLELEETEARLSVFDGAGQIEGPFGTTNLARKKTFTFNLLSQSEPTVSRKMHAIPQDAWDNWATEFHRRNATKTSMKMRHDIFR
jgi:hypothetical protein